MASPSQRPNSPGTSASSARSAWSRISIARFSVGKRASLAIAIFYVLGLLAGGIAALLSGHPDAIQVAAHTMLRYFLAVGVDMPLILAFFGHVFRSELAARRLGWPTGNPFRWEVGFWDG